VRKQKERNELRNGTYTGGFENVASAHLSNGDSAGENSGSGSELSMYSFAAKEGNEVEVNGVALTEGAVETHTPDIMAIDVLAA
jgi:hypothetical protein